MDFFGNESSWSVISANIPILETRYLIFNVQHKYIIQAFAYV